MKNIFSRTLNKIQRKLRHSKKNERHERGQVLVIVTLSVIGLVAAVGLTVDVGLLYLNHGKLRRAVDAAALAATAQFREGYDISDYEKAALEFLVLNGINDPTAVVEICDPGNPDPAICSDPPRKLVRVRATSTMQLAFLPVIGIHETTISATAVSEAASMDVVLVIDTSESMTYRADPDDPMRDPSQCNAVNSCHPFEEVKDAAIAFVEQLYFPYDRVAIVTFDNGARPVVFSGDYGTEGDGDYVAFSDNQAEIVAAIRGLEVVEPDVCNTVEGPCREYERDEDGNIIDDDGDGVGDTYLGFRCPVYNGPDEIRTGNPETCGTTSIGRGLVKAGNEFANPRTFREEALWVAILLTDGAANGPRYTCPHGTWEGAPFCRDLQLSRHCFEADDNYCLAAGGALDPDDYDADDYARDMADFIAEDQGALIFTIGLGNLVRTSVPRARLDANGLPTTEKCESGEPIDDCMGAGEQLLRYAAVEVGGGNYYFAPSGNQLEQIFLDIASKLATRLTQ